MNTTIEPGRLTVPAAQAEAKVLKKQTSKPRVSTPVSLLAGGTAGAVEAFITVGHHHSSSEGSPFHADILA